GRPSWRWSAPTAGEPWATPWYAPGRPAAPAPRRFTPPGPPAASRPTDGPRPPRPPRPPLTPAHPQVRRRVARERCRDSTRREDRGRTSPCPTGRGRIGDERRDRRPARLRRAGVARRRRPGSR